MPVLRPTLVLPFLLPACTIEEARLGSTSSSLADSKCTLTTCGENTSKLGLAPFHWLHPKETSEEGMRVVHFRKGLFTYMDVRVVGAQLLGDVGAITYAGAALKDSVLRIEDTKNDIQYDVKIDGVSSMPYYEDGVDGGAGVVPVYKFSYTVVGGVGTPRDTCEQAVVTKEWGAPSNYSVIFTGDEYNVVGGYVSAIGDIGGWFNIACVGDAKAKQLSIRQAEPGNTPGFTTKIEDRTAALFMFRADYCGVGQPYTVPHTPLDWENAGGWNTLDQEPTLRTVEAIWNETGAICVSNPRINDVDTGHLICGSKPACTQDQIDNWQNIGGRFITINP